MSSKIEQATKLIESVLKNDAPKDTWNLTRNGIRTIQSFNGFEVRVGGETAPYGVDLNEKGIHKGWVDNAISRCLPDVKNIMNGVYTEEEIEDLIAKEDKGLNDKLQEHIARKERELENI